MRPPKTHPKLHIHWWRKTYLSGWVLCSARGAAQEQFDGFPIRLGTVEEIRGQNQIVELYDEFILSALQTDSIKTSI